MTLLAGQHSADPLNDFAPSSGASGAAGSFPYKLPTNDDTAPKTTAIAVSIEAVLFNRADFSPALISAAVQFIWATTESADSGYAGLSTMRLDFNQYQADANPKQSESPAANRLAFFIVTFPRNYKSRSAEPNLANNDSTSF
jgi:hypothetical protein